MKIFDTFLKGVASFFIPSCDLEEKVLKRFPARYEKDIEKSLKDSWLTVGKMIDKNINKF